MQGIRMMHCTIWTEGVREIVSAEDADVKFIVSDHPVTIYNHAAPHKAQAFCYPHDPSIALKASQTIFPLNRNFCLILTNLEYAKDPTTSPLNKRTFARNYRYSMVRTDAFVRKRRLSSLEVAQVNFIIKARARRFIAAGHKEWLYPERTISEPWDKLRNTLLPSKDELWHFGGEMFAKFDSGHVHYQDEFGRTEKQREFLKKEQPVKPLRPGDLCGCGSGRSFKACCSPKPVALRPSWSEPSIRERNIMLQNGIVNVLDLDSGKDWVRVRRDLTDEQISKIYLLYEALWPRETDLLQLLPKPDENARAVYTGSIHPKSITDFALGASLYFGEIIIEHPFLHAGTVKKEFSPVENPRSYRNEFLKTVLFFLTVMPLVEDGFINLIPDPCNFDDHLRDQMFQMARSRSAGIKIDPSTEPRLKHLMEEDAKRSLMSLPKEVLRSQILRASPGLDEAAVEETMRYMDQLKERDPLAVLQEDYEVDGEKGGQFTLAKLVPNFEMAMYLAQATGSCIVTDSPTRWKELTSAINRRASLLEDPLSMLAHGINASPFGFPQNIADISEFAADRIFAAYPTLMQDVSKYLLKLDDHAPKANREANLAARFGREHKIAQLALSKARIATKEARVTCVFPHGGIQDHTVNRLLLMSSSERHLSSVPMAFFIEACG